MSAREAQRRELQFIDTPSPTAGTVATRRRCNNFKTKDLKSQSRSFSTAQESGFSAKSAFLSHICNRLWNTRPVFAVSTR